MSKTEIVPKGRYRFRITRNIQSYRDQIIVHTYKVGGDYADCVNISYTYRNNLPVQARMPHLLFEPACAVGSFLEKGSGTELMIKTAIQYAYEDVKTIPFFEFDDDSHIDCVEKDMTATPPRKPKKPLNLAYFYIAYHGMTWYEARFNAKMLDVDKYRAYKLSLSFLTDPGQKLPFLQFLQIIGRSLETLDGIGALESYYTRAATYRGFFDLIPKTKRCDMLYGWLTTFMDHYIGTTFYDKGWFIDARDMGALNATQSGGSLSSNRSYRIFSYKRMSCL